MRSRVWIYLSFLERYTFLTKKKTSFVFRLRSIEDTHPLQSVRDLLTFFGESFGFILQNLTVNFIIIKNP